LIAIHLIGLIGVMPPELASAAGDRLERCLASQVKGRRQRWGIVVKELSTGRIVFEHNASLRFNPASNIKLLTTAAALHCLGPRYRFTTQLFGRLHRGRSLPDGLYLRGSGDPTLTTATLARMAERLHKLGVRSIEGPLYLDDTAFEGRSDPPGFSRFRSSQPFRAGVSSLSLNNNVVRVTVAPGELPGQRARVALSPLSDYLQHVGWLGTTARRSRLRVATFAKGQRTGVSVTGRINVRSPERRFWRRVHHPGLFTGHTLLAQLRALGIQLRPQIRRRMRVPRGIPVLVEHRSPTLVQIVRRGNKHSSNIVAEHLLLAMGADLLGPPGTTQKGRRAVSMYLKELGLPVGSYLLENGSGLSRISHIRPLDLVRILEHIHDDFGTVGPELLSSMPVAGHDGTLKRRFGGSAAAGRVRAKTGTLGGVSCLSGYAGVGSRRLLFVFLASRVSRQWDARRRQRAMTECLVHYLQQ
jgi:D-alanyl-D-alanine carboxypeptidase/D-alanyl-D-alanine-endopeptidase (penicillin-binding protein 4)